MKRKVTFLSGLLIACVLSGRAQDTVSYKSNVTYSFINSEKNVISNTEILAPFYKKLDKLKANSTGVVSVLHIGDSHIQADYLTGMIRTLLQDEFGNAGLGLIFPGRAARTNESPLIYSSSSGPWDSNRISQSQNTLPIGISGTSLKTELTGNSIKIKSIQKEYSFNRITLFFQKDFNSYNIILKDSASQQLALAGSFTEEENNVSKIILPYSVNQIQLETVQSLPSQNQFTLYGVSLENQKPGIRYHIIGANGAKYKHYHSSPELLKQSAALHPDLIIISLGTNEAADHPNIDPKFASHADTLVSELRKLNPEAIILLTTPADFYKNRTRRNPGIQTITNKIIEVATKNKIPWWNLHDVAGGNHAADKWKKSELLQSDGIHFTRKGYELQGRLLFEAMIKGYNEYVLNRHSKTH
jgi:lysophospholipase L1-like esterase